MTRFPTHKLGAYTSVVALGLLGALASGLPELVAVVAPFAVLLVYGLARSLVPRAEVRLALAEERVVEGEGVPLAVEVRAHTPLEQVEVLVPLPAGLALDGGPNPTALRLAEGEAARLERAVRGTRWGLYEVGEVWLRVSDRFGLFQFESRSGRPAALRVYPGARALRGLVRPRDTRVSAGNQVARPKGDGIEFADLRPFAPGDPARRVNWRASARQGALWVNEAHPERNTDIVLFLDTFAEARSADGSTLDSAVRAATALAARYLEGRDRVGLVRLGGTLRWLVPGTGPTHLHRVVEALLEADASPTFVDKGIGLVPPRTLPPRALVIALTPLLDGRGRAVLLDLHARGHDLAVVEVSPVAHVAPGGGELGELAMRLWRLEREALRARYERLGIAVVAWRDDVELEAVLQEVAAFRRSARRVRAF
ncbi:MAG TPA: DUF58 domain-containing protein [Actinomycetota bacterium]|nr:DUF58 domain-containing protein [Actinomycetota bacterium]